MTQPDLRRQSCDDPVGSRSTPSTRSDTPSGCAVWGATPSGGARSASTSDPLRARTPGYPLRRLRCHFVTSNLQGAAPRRHVPLHVPLHVPPHAPPHVPLHGTLCLLNWGQGLGFERFGGLLPWGEGARRADEGTPESLAFRRLIARA